MLNEQQLKDALTFQTYKAMQYELLSLKLEDQTKRMAEALGMAKKQLDEQKEILQRPDQTPELRDEIDLLKASNAGLAEAVLKFEKALRCIAFVDGPRSAKDIAVDTLASVET